MLSGLWNGHCSDMHNGVDGVENKMRNSCGIWEPAPEFSNGEKNPIAKPYGVVYCDASLQST